MPPLPPLAEKPTDRPIFPPTVEPLCTRHIDRGNWHVYYWDHSRPVGQRLGQEAWLVVDDHGLAVPLSCEAQLQNLAFADTGHIEQSVWELQEAQRLAAQRARREAEDAQTTRELLQPQPATVSIEIDAPDDWCAFTIRVGGGHAALEAPHYRLHVAGHSLCVSHAQLAALGLAAAELCKPARAARTPDTVRGAVQ